MIQLVLDRARNEPVLGELVDATMTILCLYPHTFSSGDVRHVARDRQAAFEIREVTLLPHDSRIDQFVCTTLCLNDRNVERLPKLGGRKPSPWGGTHGVREIVEQGVQQPPEALHGLTWHTEAWISEEQDRLHTHPTILPID